jgi:hypothetical protein
MVRLAQIYAALEDEAAATKVLTIAFSILDGFHREGRPMDPQMRSMHEQLAPMFEVE